MHDSALNSARLFFETYVPQGSTPTIADIGALDVNGSIRAVAPRDARYIGVDFAVGNGVDVVLDDPYKLPFEDGSMDIVVSSSCLEHSEMFWLLFVEMLRVLRPHGLLYINAPSNGAFHRYPVDCWRFYPDSGNALVRWAHRCGMHAGLLESFVSSQSAENPWGWNDFVAVFVRDTDHAKQHHRRMLDSRVDFYNGISDRHNEIVRAQVLTEDMQKLRDCNALPQRSLPPNL